MRTSENELSGRDGLPKNNRILSIDGVLQVSGDGGWAGRILSACKAPSCILGALHTQLPSDKADAVAGYGWQVFYLVISPLAP